MEARNTLIRGGGNPNSQVLTIRRRKRKVSPKGLLHSEVETRELYRMPWSRSDNAFSWVEPTRYCDLRCEYCYQYHDPTSHKSLEQFEEELRGLLKLRRCDTVFVAGGEPLTHPQIVEIIRLVKSFDVKPVILTNGHSLTQDLVKELRLAGAHGFVFHVDSHQHRPGWKGKSEKELNRLRQELADMVYHEGGMICGFNSTILPETLKEVPDIVQWTVENIHKVATHVIIPVRMVHKDDPWEYYVGTEKIKLEDTVYANKKHYRNITAVEIYDELLKVLPNFRFNSYLGGTILAESPKWLFGNNIGTRNKIYGNMGSRGMELVQSFHHLAKGKYLSYMKPGMYRRARLIFFLGLFDREIRNTFRNYLSESLRNPKRFFEKMYIQTITVMQPQDILPTGEQDRCDGCPNMTYWNGRLVSECRMEDYLKYGDLIQIVRKNEIKK
jgi:MoaA/NifB/PqqE/SkfB family radical SAM enzyme